MYLGWWCLTPLSKCKSTISLLSVLLLGETGITKENHRPDASHWKTLSHTIVSSTEWVSEWVSEWVYVNAKLRTDNAMAKRKRTNNDLQHITHNILSAISWREQVAFRWDDDDDKDDVGFALG